MARLLDRLLGRRNQERSWETHTAEQHASHLIDDIAHQRDEACHLMGGDCGESERKGNREVSNTFDGISAAGHV